jgi:hypothetical protein
VIRLLFIVQRSLILFGLADILLGAESNGVGGIIILNTFPPKSTDDSNYFLHKGFGEKNSRHIVDKNRGKDRLDVSESASVVQFVRPNSGKFGTKFVENEIISFVPVPVIENNGMTEVHAIRKKIRDRKDTFNLVFGGTVNILTEDF